MTIGLLTEEERVRAGRVPGVTFVDGAVGRRAHVVGSGLDVFEIIRDYHELGDDREVLVSELDWIEPQHLDVALAYYSAFPDEIDERLACERQLVAEALKDSRSAGRLR